MKVGSCLELKILRGNFLKGLEMSLGIQNDVMQ